jgi:hypothetical protein
MTMQANFAKIAKLSTSPRITGKSLAFTRRTDPTKPEERMKIHKLIWAVTILGLIASTIISYRSVNLWNQVEEMSATAAARATSISRAATQRPEPILQPTPTPYETTLSRVYCDTYNVDRFPDVLIEDEVDMFMLAREHAAIAVLLTECSKAYGEPYISMQNVWMVNIFEELTFGLDWLDPDWMNQGSPGFYQDSVEE